jgi:hypothetical protein
MVKKIMDLHVLSKLAFATIAPVVGGKKSLPRIPTL